MIYKINNRPSTGLQSLWTVNILKQLLTNSILITWIFRMLERISFLLELWVHCLEYVCISLLAYAVVVTFVQWHMQWQSNYWYKKFILNTLMESLCLEQEKCFSWSFSQAWNAALAAKSCCQSRKTKIIGHLLYKSLFSVDFWDTT